MKKPKPLVAVDIDDVLSDHAQAFIDFSNNLYGLNNTIEDYHEDWVRLCSIDLKEVESMSSGPYVTDVVHKLDHFADSEEVLRALLPYYDFAIITSKRTMIREDTLSWLSARYEGIFKDVHFAGIWDEISDNSKHMTKKGIAQGIGADFLIDDQPKHCLAAAEAGIQSILFGEYAWTRNIEPAHNLVKLKTWSEVYDFLCDKRKK